MNPQHKAGEMNAAALARVPPYRGPARAAIRAVAVAERGEQRGLFDV